MGMVVLKFGGTSVATADLIRLAAQKAIKAKIDGNHVVIVVSAMGKTTDTLLSLAGEVTDNPQRRELDMLLTTGEQVTISLMAMAIEAAGHKAISLTGGQIGLITDAAHTKARIKEIKADRIHVEHKNGKIVIVAGFQGVDINGEITTLGRGASDTTALALAAVLKADHCTIYTDVDGIYTADPRLVPHAKKLSNISYDEMLEMASMGAGIMHNRAIEFAKKYNVEILVRSSVTNAEGTWITNEVEQMESILVSGVALRKDLAQFVLYGLPNEPGVVASIFSAVSENNIIIDDIIQNNDGEGLAACSFTAEHSELAECKLVVEQLAKKHNIKKIICKDPIAKVSVVGVGMRSHSGVAKTMFNALAAAKVNINSITTSEIRISCIIDPNDGDLALKVIHKAFDL
jgi:aspartate kinase